MTQEGGATSTPSLNLSALNNNNISNITTSPLSSSSSTSLSTPLSSRVSQLKQLWEENIKKEENATLNSPSTTPRNPVKTRHSVRIDYLPVTTATTPVTSSTTTSNNNNSFISPVKSITSINKNLSAYFQSSPSSSSSSSDKQQQHEITSTTSNNYTTPSKSLSIQSSNNTIPAATSETRKTTSSLPEFNVDKSSSSNKKELEVVSISANSSKPSRVSQTILKFTQLIQKTTSNATTNKIHKSNEILSKQQEQSVQSENLHKSEQEQQLPSPKEKEEICVEIKPISEEINEISSIETLEINHELVQQEVEQQQQPSTITTIDSSIEETSAITLTESFPISKPEEENEQITETIPTITPIIVETTAINQINQQEEKENNIKEETKQVIKTIVESILQKVRESNNITIEIVSPQSDKQEGNTSTFSTDSTDNILTSIDTVDTEMNNGDLTESGHTSSINDASSDDDATCNDEEETSSPVVVNSFSGMDIMSSHSLKSIAETRNQMESKSGHFAEALSSSSTISFNIGSVFKDVEIEKNEDYAKYFRKTNYNTYQENINSMLDGEKRRSKSVVKKILESQLISHKIKRIIDDYRKQQWVHKQIFHTLGSKGFEDFTSPKTYTDEDELDDEEFEEVFNCGLFEEGERIVNSLYEQEISFINPLYDEEYITTNPLFDPTEDLTLCIYNFEEDEKSFVQRLKAGISRQKNLIRSKFNRMHAKSFSGSDIVDWIKENSHDKFLRLDAAWFAQQMMDRMVFINMDKFTSKFEDDPNVLYIFTDEYENSNTLNIDPNMIGVFEPQSSFMSIYRVIKQVGKEIMMKYDQSSKYNDLPIFDYQGFAFSEHFVTILNEMRKLQKIDTTTMLDPTFRKCFFINIHNIMVLHALITCGKPTNFLLRKRFFRKKKYMIGRYKLSLDMIAHGILRGEKYQRKSSGNINVGKDSISSSFREKLFKTSSEDDNPLLNAISNLRIPEFDPRIHFCLFRADMGSPKFNLFTLENMESEIDKATREYIQRETRIDLETNTIYVSKIFEWFKDDFGSQKDLMEYLFKYLDTNVSNKICILKQRDVDDITIEYKYNSSLNIPSNISNDDNKEVNVELEVIRSSEKLRPYFVSYCELEHSEENILFWARVEEYKALMDSSKQLEEGRKIYDEYLRLGSERELNLSRRMVKEIEVELLNENDDSIRADIFDPIQRVISLLMIDTYERFVTSNHYKQVVEVLREEMNIEIDTPRKSVSPLFVSTSSEDVIQSEVSFRELQHRRSRMTDIRTSDAPLTSRTSAGNNTPDSPATSSPSNSHLNNQPAGDEDCSSETLIFKKDPNWKSGTNDECDDTVHHQYILPKYIRCYNCNQHLKYLKQRTCTIVAEMELTQPNKPLQQVITTGTAFLISPFRENSINYLITCAHCVVSHQSKDGVDFEVKNLVVSFTNVRDLFERTDSISCKVVKCGKYERNNVSQDWALLSFEGSDCSISKDQFGGNVIPSPSLAANESTGEDDVYNILLVGLCSPSLKSIEMKAKEIGIDFLTLSRMIPKEAVEFSLGWITDIKENKIFHNATTTESSSGGPIFIGNHQVNEFMDLYRTSDILQKNKTAFKDYIQSHKFSSRIVGVHCGHNVEHFKNVACSVLSWFGAFYEIYLELKESYSLEEQELIENENLFMEQKLNEK
ncbi:predicted protein [Naegleria gruberi]|uniref:Predicted protein n=1 Tax=Naegleria gruberi TaxID=5762 RepID=D2VSY5_NAEGR|nr:uncharacterized protein NAEGRDRAFT_52005 [Naegleria gruberi]EFC40059.1 predicted protein [Naegleria gruberi]|eukprot:XP_002672803.1 predicted protein [Naegleria gruberi strain NEG-M]